MKLSLIFGLVAALQLHKLDKRVEAEIEAAETEEKHPKGDYASKSNVVVGHLKSLYDTYKKDVAATQKQMEETNTRMKDMAASAADPQQRDSIIDERIKEEQASQAKIDSLNDNIAAMKDALKKLTYGHWKDEDEAPAEEAPPAK